MRLVIQALDGMGDKDKDDILTYIAAIARTSFAELERARKIIAVGGRPGVLPPPPGAPPPLLNKEEVDAAAKAANRAAAFRATRPRHLPQRTAPYPAAKHGSFRKQFPRGGRAGGRGRGRTTPK